MFKYFTAFTWRAMALATGGGLGMLRRPVITLSRLALGLVAIVGLDRAK